MAYTRATEIRHISSAELATIAEILNQPSTSQPAWRKLMQIVPNELIDALNVGDAEPKYDLKHIRLIENCTHRKSAAMVFLEEWMTTGRIRPTLGHLLQLLINCELFRAADYVAINLLKEASPQRPSRGPAAKIDITLPHDEKLNSNRSSPSRSLMANLNNGHIQNKEHQHKQILDRMSVAEACQPVQSTNVTTTTKTEYSSNQTQASSNVDSNLMPAISLLRDSCSSESNEPANATTPEIALKSSNTASQMALSSGGNIPNLSFLNIQPSGVYNSDVHQSIEEASNLNLNSDHVGGTRSSIEQCEFSGPNISDLMGRSQSLS